MKRLVSSFFLLFVAFHAIGQYGDEWIQFSQRYFKIPVAREGIYRISYDALQQAGFPVTENPQTFRLFHRGVEQAIIVQGEDDGVFHSGDYIEFYGRSNDGALDSTLYENPHDQPHQYYNLYSDTTSYFLTYDVQPGKRVDTYSAPSSGLTAETHHISEKLLVLKDTYSGGIDYGKIQKTVFDAGEGWMGVQILQNQEVTYSLEGITETEIASGKPTLEILLTGRGPMVHQVELYSGARFLATIDFEAYASHRHVQELEWSDIDVNGKLPITVRVTGVDGSDRVSTGYIRVLFPRNNTMNGESERTLYLSENPVDSYLRIADAPPGVRLFDVSDPSGMMLIAADLTTTLDAVVPAALSSRKIFATSEVQSPAWIKAATFRQINPAEHNYIVVTHRSLRQPASGYVDPVKAYAEYRALPEGGNFDTFIVNIDQLYDQFNYGESSPRAIFQFMKFLAAANLPDYLFLIGKGLDPNYGYYRNPSAFPLYKDLVPSAGYPASDMAFTSGLSGTPGVPGVSTGRLTANTPAEVATYLNKVREREALKFDDLQRKKILHLSGGVEEHEPALFRDILKGFESVAEALYLGGRVQAIAKQTREIKVVNIAEEVNQGVGFITFFGHSAPNTLDFDIGLVTDPVMGYNNTGKYPLLLMNGCDAGSFFLNATIFGENWIKTPDKGAVGFIAHSSFGLVSGLQRYSSTFYNVAFGDAAFIRKGVGKVQQEVAKRYLENFGSSPLALSQLQQMVLLGDPAVKIFGAEKPDYAVEETDIFISSFHGEPVTALSDSFRIHIPVRNFGIADDENIRITITRHYNEADPLQYDSVFSPVFFSDTLTMVIRNADDNGFGMNTFSILIDADNGADELDETNNEVTFSYFIPLNSTHNLYPYDFSIVQTPQVDLSFQYTDLLADDRDFVVEVDTTATFDSGFKKQFAISARVLARLPIELLTKDSTVYYWRTRLANPLENESQAWAASSFTFIDNGPEGWAQIRIPQYAFNATSGLTVDPQLKRLEFTETISDLALKTFSSASGKPRDSVSLKVNGVEFNLLHEGNACRDNTLNLVAFDKKSTQPYPGLYFKWYETGRRLLCGREPYVINSFTAAELATGNQDDLTAYLDNIAPGDSVVLFNIGDAGYSLWPEAAKTKLGELGIAPAQLADLQDGDPVIIFGRKGSAPGSATIFHAPSPETALEIHETITGRFTAGTMTSTVIGPAQQWGQFIVRATEAEASDNVTFSILGITPASQVDTLIHNALTGQDLSDISPVQYPFLKVVMDAADDINVTSVQLSKWLVLYEPAPEGLVFYRGDLAQQVVFEGEAPSRDFGFVNISTKSFSDSLTVRYDLLNASDRTSSDSAMKISAPAPGDTTLFTVTLSTVLKTGINDVEIIVNPEIETELNYDNNRIVLSENLEVLGDRSHPVLDVTFDGRYLENNEFVRPSPVISIRLWDENPFIRKTDTVGVRMFLAYPCTEDVCAFQPIWFSRSDVSWEAAGETSDFKVDFFPSELSEGNYVLRVEAFDARGNASGEMPYQIAFQVREDRSVTVSPPYPNPFAYRTDFVITLSGDGVVPHFYTLRLMDVKGKLIADLSDNTVGLHVGKNIITWKGVGSDGQSIPGGIYLYRLLVSDGESSQEFSGKVLLMR
jgi:hypothetical protein